MVGCVVLPYFYTEAQTQSGQPRPTMGGACRAGVPMPAVRGNGGDGHPRPTGPVIIHLRGRVFALCPEAEEAGLCAGMPLGQAYAICPRAESLPYDEDLYRAAQRRVLDICAAYVSRIEPFCLHETFLDLAGAGDPAQVLAEIAEAVETQAGFTYRAGAGSSKLVARAAALEAPVGRACLRPPQSVGAHGRAPLRGQDGQPRPQDTPEGSGGDGHPRPTDTPEGNGGAKRGCCTIRLAKPRFFASRLAPTAAKAMAGRRAQRCALNDISVDDEACPDQLCDSLRQPRSTGLSLVIVPGGQEAQFLAPLPLSRLWLLDKDMIEHLEALGLTTIGLLQQTPASRLGERFGRLGRRLHELAHGVDRSPVRACYPPPVVEARLSLAEGALDMTVIEDGLRRLARKVAGQLRSREQGCRRVGLEAETDDGRSVSRSLRLSATITGEHELFRAAKRLLGRILEPSVARAKPLAPITAVMLRAADLQRCAGVQLDLLGEREQEGRRRERLTDVVASAQKRFGARSVRWAREVELPRRERMLACLTGGQR